MPPTPEELKKVITCSVGILSLLTNRIDVAVLDAASGGLKVISNYAVGYDTINISALT